MIPACKTTEMYLKSKYCCNTMVDIEKNLLRTNRELLRFFKAVMPGIYKIATEGITLENRNVSRSGNSSAVIFVPKHLAGQKVRVVITPMNSYAEGFKKDNDKKHKDNLKLLAENKELRRQIKDVNAPELEDEYKDLDEPETAEGLEEENEY